MWQTHMRVNKLGHSRYVMDVSYVAYMRDFAVILQAMGGDVLCYVHIARGHSTEM